MKINRYLFKPIITLLVFSLIGTNFISAGNGNKSKNKNSLNKVSLKAGDSFRFFINNIDMPMNRAGVLADVQVPGSKAGTKLDNIVFLFSGGFFLSGLNNGKLWANGVASASTIQDYVPGTVASGPGDSRAQIYVLKVSEGDFPASWNEWKDAVALGAYFYDGDGDGVYNPVDKNGNGKWDPTEDKPDLLGDQTAWCVYNDGQEPVNRRFTDVNPQGIEVRQTVFGFNSKSVVGNMLFVRYSLLNSGSVADVMDSVYFGVWADPDLGLPDDDLVGCDTTLNAGYVYNDGPDDEYKNNPPCFLIDFFQGPMSYIPGVTFTDNNSNGTYEDGVDTPLDTAYNVMGRTIGIKPIPGAKNLGLSSFVHYMQSHATLGDPDTKDETRYYMLGHDLKNKPLDPCTWAFSTVEGGVTCLDVDNKYWYSGDPVAKVGWINNSPVDQRQMSNTGPFKLVKGQPVDIVVAYVVGRGNNALQSIKVAKDNDQIAQIIFDNNFPSPAPPPPVEYEVKTGDGFIDLTWETHKQLNYRAIDTVLNVDKMVEGFYVTAYNTNSKVSSIGGVNNILELDHWDLADSINSIYAVAGNGGQDLRRTEATALNKLQPELFKNPASGRITIRLTQDPFTETPLIKGRKYYFTITQYALNHKAIVNRSTNTYGPAGDYLDPTASAMDEYETSIIEVTYGEDLYDPQISNKHVEEAQGHKQGDIQYLVIDKSQLTGDEYSVEFFPGSGSDGKYLPYWKLSNASKNKMLIDSSIVYDYDTTKFAGIPTEGFILKVKPQVPKLGTPKYVPSSNQWFKPLSVPRTTGAFYVGDDIDGATSIIGTNRSRIISADKLKQVELRFGDNGKAYRYLNGYVGSAVTRRSTFVYAGGVAEQDTAIGGAIGKFGQGFVDVPFTAWVKDTVLGSEYDRQLAVGFIETAWKSGTKVVPGKPDGIWNPGDSIKGTMEYILIFDEPYDPNGEQIVYKGGVFNTPSGSKTVWADVIKGYAIPQDAQGVTPEQINLASSSYFNTLYFLGLENQTETGKPTSFTPGDKLIIPVSNYPYTAANKYTFKTKANGALTEDEKKSLFKKVNVFPNPLFAYNSATAQDRINPDEPFVTFSNLPTEVTVKIYTLSGTMVRTLTTEDKAAPSSPFLRWDLQNESGLRVASGMYLAIVSAPGYGEKVLKFAIIMPQKQIQQF